MKGLVKWAGAPGTLVEWSQFSVSSTFLLGVCDFGLVALLLGACESA